jgi:putative ABC transport system permease protein
MRAPTILGVRPGVLIGFYRWRLRAHPVKELLAAAGVAVGVALIFGVLVANASMSRSAGDMIHSIVGTAQLQLAARSADGMPATITDRVRQLPGVVDAAPVLRVQATLEGPDGRAPVQIMGVTPALASLGGWRTQGWGRGGIPLARGLTLPRQLGEAVGATPGHPIRLLVGGRAQVILVGALLGREAIGVLDGTPVGIAPLAALQALAAQPGRISQVLVHTAPDRVRETEVALRAIAGDRLDVSVADHELALLRTTAAPNDLATGLFAAISAMVGLLLAFNAILLTVPERRRWVAELRSQGFSPSQVMVTLAFDAIVLGVVASVAGVLLGSWLSRTVFGAVPAYLAFAFPLGPQRIVPPGTVAIAIAGGVVTTVIASLVPAIDLRSRQPDAILAQPGEAGEAIPAPAARALGLAAGGVVVLATLLAVLVPPLTVLSGVLLALAAVLALPIVFAAALRVLARLTGGLRRSVAPLAIIELRGTATRSVAIAAVAAIAVYGVVAIEGARTDLVRGLDANFSDFLGTTDLWVTTGGDDLTTNSFTLAPGARQALERLPAVRSVRDYQGGLLDVGDRRVWVIARPPNDGTMIPASQLLVGDRSAAERQLRDGRGIAISEALADERNLHVGDRLELPTPAGTARLRVAAITTNLGWPPGAIVLNTTSYRRWWQTQAPSALQIDLRPGSDPAAAAAAVRGVLNTPALRVQTAQQRTAQYASLSRQGLRSLQQIATLMLIAAGLAVALALGAGLALRRRRLALLKIDGWSDLQLWRSILLESTITLLLGTAIGAACGIYGHVLASRWLQLATGFPAPFSPAPALVLVTIAALAAIALATLALPGYLAARVPPGASFQGD